jgi:hypothetical protein
MPLAIPHIIEAATTRAGAAPESLSKQLPRAQNALCLDDMATRQHRSGGFGWTVAAIAGAGAVILGAAGVAMVLAVAVIEAVAAAVENAAKKVASPAGTMSVAECRCQRASVSVTKDTLAAKRATSRPARKIMGSRAPREVLCSRILPLRTWAEQRTMKAVQDNRVALVRAIKDGAGRIGLIPLVPASAL